MTYAVTLGQNVKRTRGSRFELPEDPHEAVDALHALLSRDDHGEGSEGWWSGHLWHEDDRRRPVRWEGAGVIVVDVDYNSDASTAKERHTSRPDTMREKLESADIPCSMWHHTPRGARFVFVLETPTTDAEAIQNATRGSGAMINICLREVGACASLNNRRKPVNGYYADVATFDLARLMYRPKTTVAGVERAADLTLVTREPFAIEALSSFEEAPVSTSGGVSKVLATMPAEGENDGSMELMRVAAKAVRLGIADAATFVAAAAEWNRKKTVPWTEEDLERRFEDALERHRDERLVPIRYDE